MFSLSNVLSFVAGAWCVLLILMIINNKKSSAIVMRENLKWLFIVTSGLLLVVFLVALAPKVHITISPVEPWTWLILIGALVGLAIGFALWQHHRMIELAKKASTNALPTEETK